LFSLSFVFKFVCFAFVFIQYIFSLFCFSFRFFNLCSFYVVLPLFLPWILHLFLPWFLPLLFNITFVFTLCENVETPNTRLRLGGFNLTSCLPFIPACLPYPLP